MYWQTCRHLGPMGLYFTARTGWNDGRTHVTVSRRGEVLIISARNEKPGGLNVNDSADHFGFVVGWCAASLALQPVLGLLPKRWPRPRRCGLTRAFVGWPFMNLILASGFAERDERHAFPCAKPVALTEVAKRICTHFVTSRSSRRLITRETAACGRAS